MFQFTLNFAKKARYIVTKMPIKLKVKIFKISLVINYLRFRVWGFDFILALDITNVNIRKQILSVIH